MMVAVGKLGVRSGGKLMQKDWGRDMTIKMVVNMVEVGGAELLDSLGLHL